MRCVSTALVLLVCTASAFAREQPVKPDTPEQAAESVLAAVLAGDAGTLKALAEKDNPDPWLIADDLCARGRFDAALAFARAAVRPDTEALPAYVEAQRGKGAGTEAREVLEGANRAWEEGRPADALLLLDAFESSGRNVVFVRVLELRAFLCGHLGDLRGCAETWWKLGEAAEDLGWLVKAAHGFNTSAQAQAFQGNNADALELWERTLEIHEKRESRWGIAAILGNLGVAHQNLGNAKRSLELSLRALSIAEEIGATGIAINAHNSIGIAHRMTGNYLRALEAYGRAGELARGANDRAAEARAITNIGLVQYELGELEPALAALEEAVRLNDELGATDAAAGSLVNLALVHQKLGNWSAALKACEEARERAQSIGFTMCVGYADCNIGNILYSLEDLDGARGAYERALATARATGDRQSEARLRGNLGNLRLERGECVEALVEMQAALEISRELENRQLEGATLANMAVACRELGRLEEAEEKTRAAMAIAIEIGDRDRVVRTTNGLGLIALERGEPDVAEARLREGLALARELGHIELEVVVRSNLAHVLLLAGQAPAAVGEARAGVELMSLLVGGQSDELGASGRERWRRLYEFGVSAARASEDLESIYYFLESGRAGALQEALGGKEGLKRALLSPELRTLESEALRLERSALAAYQKALQDGERKPLRAARLALEEARAGVKDVARRVQLEAKLVAAAIYPQPDALPVVRRRIGTHESLVLYALLEEEALALVLARQEVRLVPLGDADAIREAILEFESLGRDVDWSSSASRLRELVAAPLDLSEECRTILISPDSTLGTVPFSLLFPDRAIGLVPSGTLLGVLESLEEGTGSGVLALGGPLVPDLPPLPAARAEAEAVGDIAIAGGEATEEALFEGLAGRARWRAIHLACHGLLDEQVPSRSSLALAPTDESDGRLTCSELFFRHIPADLVVLSACDTGRGKVLGTEGVLGLSRAFLMAGAPRVICSLWKVDDEATKALMVKFYELWNPKEGEGLPTATALKQAREFVRSHEKWKHPYYWAAWILWGLPD